MVKMIAIIAGAAIIAGLALVVRRRHRRKIIAACTQSRS